MSSDIQSVLFDRDLWTVIEARTWLRKHKFIPIKLPHQTKNKIRFRLQNPLNFRRFRIKKLGEGIELVIGFY